MKTFTQLFTPNTQSLFIWSLKHSEMCEGYKQTQCFQT